METISVGKGRAGQYMTWRYTVGVADVIIGCRYILFMIFSWYCKYFIHCFVIMKSNELIKCLPISNPEFANSKPLGGFMVRSI